MEIVTMESVAFQEMLRRLQKIEQHILERDNNEQESGICNLSDDERVDNYDVCTYLKVCDRTLLRLRTSGKISYSKLDGKIYYKIGEIRRILNDHLIRSDIEYLNDLKKGQVCYAKQRRANKLYK